MPSRPVEIWHINKKGGIFFLRTVFGHIKPNNITLVNVFNMDMSVFTGIYRPHPCPPDVHFV
jgi:hypothetical protein